VVFATPKLHASLRTDFDELELLRQKLGRQARQPTRWMGTLRRLVQATSIESSTSIEGFTVSQDEALALVSGGEDPGPDENRLAVASYARAMDHVAAMAADPEFQWSKQAILALHFDACHFQRDKDPGRWRRGPVSVVAPVGGIAYRAPDAQDVAALMSEVVDWLEEGDLAAPTVVRAAMAHLHVVTVHPFRDGNGRVARIVQSLVLARDGLVSPELASIEEYLGAHTQRYYDALTAVQGGSFQPERDATPWLELCIEAHLHQARHRLSQIDRAAARWARLEEIVEGRGWPDRLLIALEQGLMGGSDRRRYTREADVSPATASADLRRLVDAQLLVQRGQGPSSRYEASGELQEAADDIEA
jgi:Fic family protein